MLADFLILCCPALRLEWIMTIVIDLIGLKHMLRGLLLFPVSIWREFAIAIEEAVVSSG
jgi:hypothetical protein